MPRLLAASTLVALLAVPLLAQDTPRFRVDPAWPTIPNNWQFGQVASVAVDAQDHVWVLQRPGTLAPAEKPRAAPPLLEFDAAGNFIQAWGGPGPGYQWPTSEHGVYVDPQGFVWIGGNGDGDHQVLKFRRDGTFVMQIGRAGESKGNADTRNLNQPADTFVHAPTNELFVADGYGNRRIIVFDADTGAFKRMWGAFGNVPSDAPPNPALPDAEEAGAAQFVQPVHAARVSKDGLVYVSDRGGKRVQVFTLDGKYVRQVFIGRECKVPECGNGTTAASTAFSTDPEQRFLYVGNRSQAKVMIFERRTLTLLDSFGRWGSAPGEFGTLHHMAADSRGNLYVTEVTPLQPQNRRVQKFTLIQGSAGATQCPVTAPNGALFDGQKGAGNYGNDALVTMLWGAGTVTFRPRGPGFVLPDGARSMKFGWWRYRSGRLRIEGRRLDAPAPPLRATIPDGYGDIGFQATALIFPTPGCWEVTGRVGDARLTFVTRVEMRN